mgnify:CR=1 FL=1
MDEVLARIGRRRGGRVGLEQAVRDLLSKTLTMADYDVDAADDGPSAIEKLRAVEYDLLITDLKMPGMDGLTVIREARKLAPDLRVGKKALEFTMDGLDGKKVSFPKDYTGKLKIAKLNIDENQATPPKYGIRGIPTLMLFKNGNVEATKVGAVSKSQLAAFIDSNI